MKKNFQYIVLGAFIFFGILAVLIFSGVFSKGSSSDAGSANTGPVVIWGIYPQAIISRTLNEGQVVLPAAIQYVEKNPATIEREFVEALASGSGPDALLIPFPMTLSQKDKFYTIPYTTLPVRNFKDTFISGTELFLTTEGVTAFPIFTDPMVMYWNRTMFNNAGISKAPSFWDEFLTLPDKLTTKDTKGNITQSAVAMGGYRNVTHAKDIVSTIILQSGDGIVVRGSRGEGQVVLGNNRNETESALRFFMDFSNPAKSVYSWNSAMSDSIDAFASGKLAVYFGYASEYSKIRAKNSHLDFDIAPMPQIKGGKSQVSFGQFYAIALVKNSPRIANAFGVAQFIAFGDLAPYFASVSNYSSVRRDALAKQVIDPNVTIFNKAALISKGWIDVDPAVTDNIFRDMIDNIQVGRYGIAQSVSIAKAAMTTLFSPNPQ